MGSKLSDVVSFDKTKISYFVKSGIEPSLIFIHGAGSNYSTWKEYLNKFQNKIIAIDLRGHGRSQEGKFTIENIVEDIELIRRKEKINKLVLVGNSLGSTIAIKYQNKYPKNVSKLILNVPFYDENVIFGRIGKIIAFLLQILPIRKKKRIFIDYGKYKNKPIWVSPVPDLKGTSFQIYMKAIYLALKTKIKFPNCPTIAILGKQDHLCKSHKTILLGNRQTTFVLVDSHHLVTAREPQKIINIIKNSL